MSNSSSQNKFYSITGPMHLLSVRNPGYRRFLMTGSSAHKLKRGAANLLARRAVLQHMFPLTTHEKRAAAGGFDNSLPADFEGIAWDACHARGCISSLSARRGSAGRLSLVRYPVIPPPVQAATYPA